LTSTPSPPPSSSPHSFTKEELVAFILYPAINSALDSLARALSSHTAPVIDGTIVDYLSVKEGLFPSHLGGPMWYAEKVLSFQTVVKGMKELSEKHPSPSPSSSAVLDTGTGDAGYRSCELLESIVEGSASLTEELFFRAKYQKR
jgi:hypothetical protein